MYRGGSLHLMQENQEVYISAIKRRWIRVALLWLVLIALAGTLMRLMMVEPAGWFQYKHLLHSHSHVAMLGWVFTAFLVALMHCYLPPDAFRKKVYKILFWLTQVSVAGMLVTFAMQGYAALSITFSTIHILLSYWFIVVMLRDVWKQVQIKKVHKTSLHFIVAGLFFLFLSSFGPWGLAITSAKGMAGSELYTSCIYFYLHFLYNGWFTLALLGLLVWQMEKQNISFNQQRIKLAFWLMAIAAIPAFILSLLEFEIPEFIYWIGVISGVMQLAGAVIFLVEYLRHRNFTLGSQSWWTRALLAAALFAFLLKFIMQALSPIPALAIIAFTSRDLIVGYIHLVMIGFVSFALFAWLAQQGMMQFSRWISRAGLTIFFSGFIVSEALLFLQPLLLFTKQGFIPHYYNNLFLFAFAMFIGLTLVWIGNLATKPPAQKKFTK